MLEGANAKRLATHHAGMLSQESMSKGPCANFSTSGAKLIWVGK